MGVSSMHFLEQSDNYDDTENTCFKYFNAEILDLCHFNPERSLLTKMGFCVLGAGYYECNKFLDFLKLFEAIDMDGSFPMSHCM
jgi:hypothetical protein